MKKINPTVILILVLFSTFGCKEEPSVLKVFVRDQTGKELNKGSVIVNVANDANYPKTVKFSEKSQTESGSHFAVFNLDGFFATQRATYGDTVRDGYLKIYARYLEFESDTSVRVTFKTTSVQTVYINTNLKK